MSVKNLGTDWIDLILIDVVTLSIVVTNLMPASSADEFCISRLKPDSPLSPFPDLAKKEKFKTSLTRMAVRAGTRFLSCKATYNMPLPPGRMLVQLMLFPLLPYGTSWVFRRCWVCCSKDTTHWRDKGSNAGLRSGTQYAKAAFCPS